MSFKINRHFYLCFIILFLVALSLLSCACSQSSSDDAVNAQMSSQQNVDNTNDTSDTKQVDAELEVTFFDVGQGDSALVTCDDKYLLIDGGDSKKSSVIYNDLDKRNISFLDYIIITHTDSDHCGGVSGALNRANVGTCYCSEKKASSNAWKYVIANLDAQGKDITIPAVGDSFSLGDATVTFMAPSKIGTSDNNNSLVCRIDYGNNSFLFTGDAESEEEEELISSTFDLDVDVLKVSHHGSDKCTSSTFLSYVKPEYAVISVGKNSYGHPGSSFLERLKKYTSKIFRTDESGDITFKSDGENISVSCSR
ncbi:MAG: MBL fold metallo-hydrolase [Coriobacteriales bacterium]|nr:MBL fold metallo-hydrolase [Coriobacteriales bacterium]